MRAINRLTFWMNGFLAALLVAVLGLCGVLIGKLSDPEPRAHVACRSARGWGRR